MRGRQSDAGTCERLSKWGALRAAARVTPKASRVAGFIVMWAEAMRAEERDDYSISSISVTGTRESARRTGNRASSASSGQSRDPNELARQILKHLDTSTTKREIATLPSRLQVTGERAAPVLTVDEVAARTAFSRRRSCVHSSRKSSLARKCGTGG